MKRRHFLALSFGTIPCISPLFAQGYKISKPKAWSASSINNAALALYGREKFSTIQKSENIELIVPKAIVGDRKNIPITVRTTIKAKTVALFQDSNPKSLTAVFHVNEDSIIAYEINIRMAYKGTLFAVAEGVDGKLYYTRQYIDVLTLACMASGR